MKDMKTIVANSIKEFMYNHNMDQKQFYKYLNEKGLNVGTTTVNVWVRGIKAPTRGENQKKLFEILGLQINDGYNNLYDVSKRKFPLLGKVACGEPIFADEDKECYIMADKDINADFCLIAKGDSMLPLIHNGDIVFVKKQSMVNNGEIAVVIIDDEATLKRVYQNEDMITLMPENREYKPIMIKNSDIKNILICGKAVAYQSLLK